MTPSRLRQGFENFHIYRNSDNFVCALAILRYLLRRRATMGGAGCNFSGGTKMGREGLNREWFLRGRWPAAASTISSSNLNSTTCYFEAGDAFLLLRFARHYRRWPGGSIFSPPSGIPMPGFCKRSMEDRGAPLDLGVIDVRPKIQFATMTTK